MEIKLLQFNIWWLRILGLWDTRQRGLAGVIHTFCFIFPQILNSFSGTINMIQCNGILNCYLENATYTVLTVTGIYIFFAYLYNQKLYQDAAVILNGLVKEFNTYAYTKAAERFTRKLSTAFTVYYMLGLLEYGVSPLIDYSSCLKRDNKGNALTCGLPTPGYFPFNSVDSPGFEVAFIFQCVCAILCIKSVVQPLMMCATMTYHVITQLSMLKDNLKMICKEESKDRCKILQRCVDHHVALLNYTKIIATALNQLLFQYAVLMAPILSILGIQIIQMFVTTVELSNLSRYVIILFGWLVIILSLSVVGQTLIDESLEVADFAYNVPWYDESIEFQKMIWLIILRANKPLVLRCASISDLSFPSFAKLVSTSYSYLTLLYKVLLVNEEDK